MTPAPITVNGQPRDLVGQGTLDDVVADLTRGTTSGIAVAVNDEVVPRTDWARTRLGPGDRVEVVTALQGG